MAGENGSKSLWLIADGLLLEIRTTESRAISHRLFVLWLYAICSFLWTRDERDLPAGFPAGKSYTVLLEVAAGSHE